MINVIVQTDYACLDRLSRIETYLAIAKVISMRGTCRRARVGCVITIENRIVATGYNGSLLDTHCLECNTSEKCKDAIHAEGNAIAFAAKHGIALLGGILYCTHQPCMECAKLIIQAGIKSVMYLEKYTGEDSTHFLRLNNVSIDQHG